MHESVNPNARWIQACSTSRSNGFSSAIRLRWHYWLPIAVILLFCWIDSVNLEYAAIGGAEVYAERTSSNTQRQVAFLGLGVTGAYLLFQTRSRSRNCPISWTILLPVMALVSYLYLSLFWSDDPFTTVKRSVTATCLVLAGLGIGLTWNLNDYCKGLVIISSIILAVGLMVELIFRSFLHVSFADYRFSGLFHPAKQSFNCGILLVASLTLYFTDKRRIWFLLAAAAMAFLLLTKARTGTLASFLAGGWLIWNFSPRKNVLLGGLGFAGLVASALLAYCGATGKTFEISDVATMGRDADVANPAELTGRTTIWKHGINEFFKQPILGYGYGAFWTESRFWEFECSNGWALAHAHSAYLESLLNVGMVGVVLGLLVLIFAGHRCTIIAKSWNPQARIFGALLILSLVSGLLEVAFIALGYESLVLMAGIGLMIFFDGETGANSL